MDPFGSRSRYNTLGLDQSCGRNARFGVPDDKGTNKEKKIWPRYLSEGWAITALTDGDNGGRQQPTSSSPGRILLLLATRRDAAESVKLEALQRTGFEAPAQCLLGVLCVIFAGLRDLEDGFN